MSRQSNQNERTISYLLGTLSDEERAQVEERYFSDDFEFEEVEIAEDELIDSYVRGELSSTQNAQFEKRMAESPRLVQRVEFARTWNSKMAGLITPSSPRVAIAPESDRDERSWWARLFGLSDASRTGRLVTAFAVLILLVVGAGLIAGWFKWKEAERRADEQSASEQRQRELERQAADQKARSEQVANQTSSQSPPIEVRSPDVTSPQETKRAGRTLALILSPGATRGEGVRSISISSETSLVVLTLDIRDSDYAKYQASVETVEKTAVFSSKPASPRRTKSGATLTFTVPATQLPPGDYIVNVDGITPTGGQEKNVLYYRFRVTR